MAVTHDPYGKGKVLPYSLPSVGPLDDPGVQAANLQVTLSHPPCSRLLLLSARPAVTFPAKERHRPSASTNLYCLVTEAHGCEQLAQDCYSTARRPGLKLHQVSSPMLQPLDYRVTLADLYDPYKILVTNLTHYQ